MEVRAKRGRGKVAVRRGIGRRDGVRDLTWGYVLIEGVQAGRRLISQIQQQKMILDNDYRVNLKCCNSLRACVKLLIYLQQLLV